MNPVDVPRAHRHQHMARLESILQIRDKLVKRGGKIRRNTACSAAGHQLPGDIVRFGRHQLAGSVDRRNQHLIRQLQTLCKRVHQRDCARDLMRLKDRPERALAIDFACGL